MKGLMKEVKKNVADLLLCQAQVLLKTSTIILKMKLIFYKVTETNLVTFFTFR